MKRRFGVTILSLLLIAVFVGSAFISEVGAASTTGFVKQNGEWVFLRDGKFDSSFTGFAKSTYNGKWYYATNGKLNWNYTGLGKSLADGKWYYASKGEYNNTYTGLVKHGSKYYAVYKGRVRFDFTGVVKYQKDGKWYYVEKGVYNKKYTGLAKSITNGKWYYVSNGELDWKETGLKSYKGSWYYVINGEVSRTYTGLVKNGNGYFYVEKGKYNDSYTGVSKSSARKGLYYVSNGSYDKSFTGVVKNPSDGKLYYVEKGEVNTGFTGTKKLNGVYYNIKKGICTVAPAFEILSYSVSKDSSGVHATVTFKNSTKKVINLPTVEATLYDKDKDELGKMKFQSWITLTPGQSVTKTVTFDGDGFSTAAYFSIDDRCYGEKYGDDSTGNWIYFSTDRAPKNVAVTKAGTGKTLKAASKSSSSVIDNSVGNPYGKKADIAVSKIYFDKDGKNLTANTKLKNNTGKTITSLGIHVEILDKKGNVIDWFIAKAGNNIKADATAVITAYPKAKEGFSESDIAYFTICYYDFTAGGKAYKGYFPTIPKAAKK